MDPTRHLRLFLEEARSHVEAALALVRGTAARSPDRGTTSALARHLHSLKGIASCMGRSPLARIAHECEDNLARWAEGGDPEAGEAVRSGLERCERMLSRMERIERSDKHEAASLVPRVPWRLELELLPGTDPLPLLAALAGALGPVRCCRPARAALRRGARPRRLSVVLRTSADPARLGAALARLAGIERFYLEPALLSFRDLLRPLVAAGTALAESLGKRVRFEVSGPDVKLDRRRSAALLEALVHVVRNAVDHGIENPEQRRAEGKRRVGLVRIRAETGRRRLRILVEDDGRGFDPAAAGRPARLAPAVGAGTAPLAEQVSGRRIGLLAAARALEPARGTLRLRGRPGRGTLVELVLPRLAG